MNDLSNFLELNNITISYVSIIGFVLFLSFVFTSLLIKFSSVIGIIDKPNVRKVHNKIIARTGGIGIFLSFIIGVFLLRVWEYNEKYDINLLSILIGILLIVFFGIIDDKFELSAKFKLGFQFLGCSIIVFYGEISLNSLNIPLLNLNLNLSDFGFLCDLFSIIWLLAILNAVNLIDGLDGLASGLSIISLCTISFMSILLGDFFVFSICLLLIMSCLGFFYFNFNPAKIFMGDTGSQFLGLMLGILTLLNLKKILLFSFLVPVLILIIPILDTCLAILRRYLNGKPLGMADRGHLHHRFIDKGMSQKKTVCFICVINWFRTSN